LRKKLYLGGRLGLGGLGLLLRALHLGGVALARRPQLLRPAT
jgi:hypothetical protein